MTVTNMGPRNLTILFISTVAVSLVLLILLFSLIFKNVDLSFDTKMPESAPDLGNFYKDGQPSHTRGDNVNGSSVRVPANAAPAAPTRPSSGVGDDDLSKLQEEEPVVKDEEEIESQSETTPPTPTPQTSAPTPSTTPTAKPAATKPTPRPSRIDPEATSAPPPTPNNPAPAGPSNNAD